MDRPLFKALHKGSPRVALRRAIDDLDEQSFESLREHAKELDFDLLVTLLAKPMPEGLALEVGPFIDRLLELLIELLALPHPGTDYSVPGVGAATHVLDLSQ